jgi:hypothetical protein
MCKIFSPLPNFKVDTDRLYSEMFHFWRPKINSLATSTSFTTAKKYVDDLDYDFFKYIGPSQFISKSLLLKKYPDGEIDQELIYWPKLLENSYMKELGEHFSNLFQIKNYRVRASYFNTWGANEDFLATDLHADPHTPYRLHIALKTNPDVKWIFVDELGKTHYIHQLADGVPVLIETGNTKHQVKIPKNSIRIHLWFQYYENIDQTLLDNILTV